VRLAALAGLGPVVLGLIVMPWGRDNESSGMRNDRHKASFRSPLVSVVVDSCQTNSSAPRFVVSKASGTLRSEEAATLGLTVDGAADGAYVVISGFETGSLFSVGRSVSSNVWSVPASQIGIATITPPRGFAGSMDITSGLVLADGKLADRGTLHLEWRRPRSALQSLASSRQISATEVHALLSRGNALEATGDLAGARLVFQRAAEAGSARAAFMLAETYDPIVLETLRESGLASNVATARVWYAKAKDLGSDEAPERLERLAHRAD
jgi:TPR repeat protein